MPRLRNRSDWLVGKSEFSSLASCIRLPTKKTVLSRYDHVRSELPGNSSSRDVFRSILNELQIVWQKAGIPILEDNNYCLTLLLNLHEKRVKIKKIKEENRKDAAGVFKAQIDSFAAELEELFDISARDTYKLLSKSRRPNWEEDWAFLENQRGSRTYYMTVPDDSVAEFHERQNRRRQKFNFHNEKASRAPT